MDIILASPRGFCAGVTRAIDIVEKALEKYGAPVYVRHEIVHNKYVVENLKNKGAIFVDEIFQIPKGSVAIFSAHGVSDKVEQDAKDRNLPVIDATCPLVTKVHKEAIRAEAEDRQLIIIGHKHHAEVEGTAGRVKQQALIISSVAEIDELNVIDPNKLSYVTQTTLSVDDTKHIIEKLTEKFPTITGPALKDICYATQNRQNAVKLLAKDADVILVIGAVNSSNSNRLKDLGQELGVNSYLINDYRDIDINWFNTATKIGITAGASAPEILVDEVIKFLVDKFNANISYVADIIENVKFKLPKELAA